MKKRMSNDGATLTDALNINYKAPSNRIWQIFHMLPLAFFTQTNAVSVIRLNGAIGKIGRNSGLSIESLNEQIENAFKVSKLAAVCLIVNSPGGSPVQSDLIASRIMSLAAAKDVPVYSFVEDMAASGGYWIACAASEIYASRSSIIGSIGVVSSGFGFHDAIAKLGVERRVFTEGKNKSVLDPFSPTKPSDVKIIKNLQKNVHKHFIDHVKASRKSRLTQSEDVLFNGEFWTGETAVDFGLIDGISNIYDFVKERFGDSVKIKFFGQKESWLKKKFGIDIEGVVCSFVDHLYNKIKKQNFDLDA